MGLREPEICLTSTYRSCLRVFRLATDITYHFHVRIYVAASVLLYLKASSEWAYGTVSLLRTA
jgi:hypothetical protein